ncbi:MAG: cytochrome c [Calditrichaeota bacterium]|nr:MAG: cytochrome c [Calditrichota bacterium]MBL1206623.1 cytochrome c [Calditrichota bacterium]NOG46450.1 cytochrome c [Calditrichota bacterium]
MGRFILKLNIKKWLKQVLSLVVLPLIFVGCFRGTPSEKPAIHLNPNMDDQQRYDPQEESEFFADGLTMRPLVEGTVARGELNEDDAYYRGRDENGNYLKTIPMEVTHGLMARGQERYDIFCAPCHSRSGDGKGIVPKRGFLPPPSFFQENVLAFDDGYIYEVINNGVRNMPAYRKQIPVNDRWAIVAYVRALQRTQTATVEDLPKDKLNELN